MMAIKQHKKMQVNFLFLIVHLFLLTNVSIAQELKGGLEKGQKVPNIQINSLPLASGKSLMMSELAGKLVILDFWNTLCSACINNMPYMDSLQVKFNDKIQIILVTNNTIEQVNKRFKTNGQKLPEHLISITNDIELTKLFPHYGEPHHVWIDQKGIYRLATFDHNTTEKSITEFLSENKISFTERKFGIWNENQPLLSQLSEKFLPLTIKYSIFLKGLSEFTDIGGSGEFTNDSLHNWPQSFKAINVTPLSLLKSAFDREIYSFEGGFYNNDNRLILETSDNKNLFEPQTRDLIDQWRKNNILSWEIKLIPTSSDDLFHAMQRELKHTLPYQGLIELRKVKYLALVKIDNNDKLRSQSSAQQKSIKFSKEGIFFNSAEVTDLVKQMDWHTKTDLPIVDETAINFPIDFHITAKNLTDLISLRQELKRFGLDLIQKEGKIKMLVIKDNPELN